eukprot:scaffold3053_cov214-Prasinococcus_capsulatus_cf.AAC.6
MSPTGCAGGWEDYKLDPYALAAGAGGTIRDSARVSSPSTDKDELLLPSEEGQDDGEDPRTPSSPDGSDLAVESEHAAAGQLNVAVSALHSEASEDCDIDQVHMHALTNSYFVKRFVLEPRPLLVKGGASRYMLPTTACHQRQLRLIYGALKQS